MPLAFSQHRTAACSSPCPLARQTELALGAVLGEALAGCEGVGAATYTHPLLVLFRSARPQHCWVCCVGPSSYTRAARESGKSPRKEEGAWAPLPMDTRKEICQTVHVPAPRHSSCPILVMPWQLYSSIVLYGRKDPRKAGSISDSPCHMSPTHCHLPMGNSTSPHHSPCSSSWQARSSASFPLQASIQSPETHP